MPDSTSNNTGKMTGHQLFVAAIGVLAALCGLIVGLGIALSLATIDRTPAPSAKDAVSILESVDLTVTPTASHYSSAVTGTVPPHLLAPSDRALIPDVGPATELYAFYVNWGDEAYESLSTHAEKIDVLVPMWYHLDSNGRLTVDDPVEQAQVLALIKRKNPGMRVMPLVNNYDKASESWNAPAVSALLRDSARRVEIAEHIVTTLDQAGFDGMNIDFENFKEADRETLVAFMEELYPRAKQAGLVVSMDVIVGSRAYDHTRLANNVDFMVPMMYDEHWKTSPPGPISSQPWFEKTLAGYYRKVPAEKVAVGLGVYSYEYGEAGERAASLTWADAVKLAKQKDAVIELDGTQKNAHFSYTEGAVTHNVWMLDAVSAFNQISWASDTEPKGYAIWRLGAEDPDLWKVLPERDRLDVDVAALLNDSQRSVRYDSASGLIVEERLIP